MPLRHSEEVHASFDAQELEVRIDPRVESPTEERICVNGDASQSFQGMRNCNSSQNITSRRGLEAIKTTVAFLCLLLSAFLNFFLLTVVHDIGVVSSAVVGFAVVLLHRDRLIVLRRVFLLAAILYGLRAVILGVTYLPPSFANRNKYCAVTLCSVDILYFTQLQYTPRGLVILRYIAMPITYLGIAALVVSGGHYTMDVLIAYWLTSHVFWSYHQIFEMPRHLRINAPLSRVWWFWLGYWFEAEVPESVEVMGWAHNLHSFFVDSLMTHICMSYTKMSQFPCFLSETQQSCLATLSRGLMLFCVSLVHNQHPFLATHGRMPQLSRLHTRRVDQTRLKTET
ncbi:phosphatidylcholine:ceramide cholinephosphotransferase 2 [Ditylenchus destructor]|nr:phosphatidylcholine:ceramide cholinephosphotransferase 2 [Ditylenchus destructor]